MPTIFAIDGAEEFGEFGYLGELGAYSAGVASLQTSLVTLGQKVNDATLKALVLDGLIGPKTTAATNRAFAMYIQGAPAQYSTGTLTQAQVSSSASSLAQYVNAEIARRGGTANSATAPVRVPAAATPVAISPYSPSALPAVSDSSTQIVKWAAIGLGGVVVAGILYYMWRMQQGGARRPAFRGYDLDGAHEALLAQIEDTERALRDCRRQRASRASRSSASGDLASRCRKLRIALDYLKDEARGSQRWRARE